GSLPADDSSALPSDHSWRAPERRCPGGPSAKRLGGEGVRAGAALEPRTPRLLAVRYPAEDRLIGRVQAGEPVVEDRAVDGGVLRAGGFAGGQLRFLLGRGGGLALPRRPQVRRCIRRAIVAPAAQPPRLLQEPLLLGGGPHLIFACLWPRLHRLLVHGLQSPRRVSEWHGEGAIPPQLEG